MCERLNRLKGVPCNKHVEKYSQHLTKVHNVDAEQARIEQNFYNVLFTYFTHIDYAGVRKPKLCIVCGMLTHRLTRHLKTIHSDRYLQDSNFNLLNEDIQESEEKTYHEIFSKLDKTSHVTPIIPPSEPILLPSSIIHPTQHSSHSDADSDSSTDSHTMSPSPSFSSDHPKRTHDSFSICKQTSTAISLCILEKKKAVIPGMHDASFCDYFKYFYDNFSDAIADFTSWLHAGTNTPLKQVEQIVKQVGSVWTIVDPNQDIYPICLLNADSIESKYLNSIFSNLKLNRTKLPKDRVDCPKPSTIKNVLNAIKSLVNFSLGRRIFIGIEREELDIMLIRLSEMTKLLKPDSIMRIKNINAITS